MENFKASHWVCVAVEKRFVTIAGVNKSFFALDSQGEAFRVFLEKDEVCDEIYE